MPNRIMEPTRQWMAVFINITEALSLNISQKTSA